MTATDGNGDLAHRSAPLDMSPEEFRELGHRMVDRIAALFEGMPERRVAPDTKPAQIPQDPGPWRSAARGHRPVAYS